MFKSAIVQLNFYMIFSPSYKDGLILNYTQIKKISYTSKFCFEFSFIPFLNNEFDYLPSVLQIYV